MKQNLLQIRKNWEEFAQKDPLWSILPIPEKKDNRWNIEELYETGHREISSVMNYIKNLNMKIEYRRALDFGCGVGRLTQALCEFFDECIGIDISFQMLRLARSYNKYGNRCRYILNCSSDLKIFKDEIFDFIYSNIVFQHLPPDLTLGYIKEFIRVLKKGGMIIFQITTGVVGIKNIMRRTISSVLPVPLRHLYKKLRYKTWAIKDMYYIKTEKLNDFITKSGGKIVDIVDDSSSLPRYEGKRYCITK
ncbi:MAG: class I SAM-dependent methyltransferase [candidate division WOR-3 bacterium]